MRAIESVQQQPGVRVEHIVIDGGSKDGTVELLEKQTQVRWVSEPDDGQADAFNKGLGMARAPLIGWLNADDFYLPGSLSRVIDYFTGHPEARLLNCGLQRVDAHGRVVEELPARSSRFWLRHFWFRWYGLNHPSTFYRRDLFEEVGPVDASLHYAMDYDFYLRASLVTDFFDLPDVTTQMLVHDASKTSEGWSPFAEDVRRTLKKVWGHTPLFYRYSLIGTSMHEARHHLVESFVAQRAGNAAMSSEHHRRAKAAFRLLPLMPAYYPWCLRRFLWRLLGEQRYARLTGQSVSGSESDG